MSSKIKKLVDEARESENPELDLVDKGIANILEIPGFGEFLCLTSEVTTAVVPSH